MVAHRSPRDSDLDGLIANTIIFDPILGIFKGDIGIKDGLIVGIGRAGNPDIMDGVDLVIGPNTNILPGGNLIATPGGVDSHVHINSPKLMDVAISAGLTTFIGAGLNTNDFSLSRSISRPSRRFPLTWESRAGARPAIRRR